MGEFTDGKAVGRKRFEFQGKPFGMPGVQVGFLSSDGKYVVTITVSGTAKPSLEAARKLAKAVDQRLVSGHHLSRSLAKSQRKISKTVSKKLRPHAGH